MIGTLNNVIDFPSQIIWPPMFRSLILTILILGLGLGIQRGWIMVDWPFMQADLKSLWEQFDQRSQEHRNQQ